MAVSSEDTFDGHGIHEKNLRYGGKCVQLTGSSENRQRLGWSVWLLKAAIHQLETGERMVEHAWGPWRFLIRFLDIRGWK